MAKISKLAELKVLVVEDQSEARAMLRNMLTELGVTQIFEASDGKEAFSFFDSAFDLVDFIVCDWNMPGMTGVEFLRQVRSVDQEMPFLMVTGRGDFNSVTEAKKSGVTAFIKKPFSLIQLEAKIRIIMGRQEARAKS
ncbi:MAG: response regulator [Rhodospirillales bacterium]|nr:response regulator [Alphaproteobacteria bacterium]MCB1840174.1 response regulator [Alphaproteobacteria bacterium]MCB9977768.1 response regulator [Rhodospirillales bacterium]